MAWQSSPYQRRGARKKAKHRLEDSSQVRDIKSSQGKESMQERIKKIARERKDKEKRDNAS